MKNRRNIRTGRKTRDKDETVPGLARHTDYREDQVPDQYNNPTKPSKQTKSCSML